MKKHLIRILAAFLCVAMVFCFIPSTAFAAADRAEDIIYEMDSDETLDFKEKDFNAVCEDLTDEELDYVKFTLPDDDDGILYYDYDEDDDDNTEVSSTKKYYYSQSPYISRITFVPDKDYSGTLTIKYTGRDEDGNSFSGKIKITVEDSGSSTLITYTISYDKDFIVFDEDDFFDVCEELQDEDLDYVKFTLPDDEDGILYYNYDEDEDDEDNTKVSSSKKYYYDSSPRLSRITFVPDVEFSGSVTIKYRGYDTDGDSYSEKIKITVRGYDGEDDPDDEITDNADMITYTSRPNTAILMKDEDFNNVCRKLTGSPLNYVTFTLSSSTYGTLYYGYTSSGNYTSKVKAASKYYYNGSPYLLNVVFLPDKDLTGTVTIDYKGYDSNGAYYSGKVQIKLTSTGDTTPTQPTQPGNTPAQPGELISSEHFNDVTTDYSWAVPYVDSLYEAGIITGSSSGSTKLYSPAANITRGDYMLILYRALNMKTSSTTSNFADVPSGSYYYSAIITAKALGIAQGSDNHFYPNDTITREDAMVLALRAVNITGKTIPSGDINSLSVYADSGSISDYAGSAVAALIKAGVITGDDDNLIHPRGNLTRVQVAAIVYRIKNL